MEFHQILRILSILSMVIVACHAAQSPEAYWKSKLPNTLMPKAIKDSLSTTEWEEEKSTAVGVGKGGVNVGTHYPGKPPVYVGVTPSENPFDYNYAATEDQLRRHNPNTAIFFTKNQLLQQKGNSNNDAEGIKLHFKRSTNAAAFLPRSVTGKTPFSAAKLPQILSALSLSPNSKAAEAMKQTLGDCEAPTVKGEEKLCSTSLESMVDFSIAHLGKNIKAISTEAERETPAQKYTIKGSQKMGRDGKAVACHKKSYPYAVFYCHSTKTTQVYDVSLVGSDGTKVKAVAVCHNDTSNWNPNHLAFKLLNLKPGTAPICHFLPEDHVVWVNN